MKHVCYVCNHTDAYNHLNTYVKYTTIGLLKKEVLKVHSHCTPVEVAVATPRPKSAQCPFTAKSLPSPWHANGMAVPCH